MGECDKLYVLGHPVGHSKSPVMHNAAYAALRLPWHYDFADFAVPGEARAFVREGAWLALNVTTPYKPLALACADDASEAACLAGGANVLVRAGGAVHADNVDGAGCVAFLRRQGIALDGVDVAVCGTGPTSLSIMHACARAGARRVSLFGRNVERTQAIVGAYCERLAGLSRGPSSELATRARGDSGAERDAERDAGHAPGASCAACSYDGDADVLSAAHLIVDATPLGMKPGDPAPFDTSLLSAGQVVVDVVYGHGETALIGAARAAGCRTFDGAGMLVGQAVESVRVIVELTGLPCVPDDAGRAGLAGLPDVSADAGRTGLAGAFGDVDLFAIMSEAAGFSELWE